MRILWHLDFVTDRCRPEDEKRLWFLVSDNRVVVVIR